MSIKNPIIIILLFILCLGSCKSSSKIIEKKSTSKSLKTNPQTDISIESNIKPTDLNSIPESENIGKSGSKIYGIIDYAKQFSGVKYKFGGATRDGMDCSGLVFESFRAFDIILPRISRDMAKKGDKVLLVNTQEGDLLFFRTMNRRNAISHVGLVITAENGEIEFIHSTTSSGVIVSKLSEKYWNSAFVEARRIL